MALCRDASASIQGHPVVWGWSFFMVMEHAKAFPIFFLLFHTPPYTLDSRAHTKRGGRDHRSLAMADHPSRVRIASCMHLYPVAIIPLTNHRFMLAKLFDIKD